ncbi:MAG TPA: ZIP family metal transporter [Methylotenera sp.]|nr:ZIP family metal transporter [Methylotenera sp.]HPH04790.1 ZIP family metal transporter [Methylotenera sp.]HPN01587.1 ZIP family metal transporter [Methylotenera sp.]
MLSFSTYTAQFSTLTWIILFSLIGGLLSVAGAALVALSARATAIPMLISYAIGAMLGAVFLEILPEAIHIASSPQQMTGTVLFGILLFFTLEKLVIWRHCHGDHCEVHALHSEADCPDANPKKSANIKGDALQASKYKASSGAKNARAVKVSHSHNHSHDHGRSGMMVMIGDTFHNFVDGILIASAFMVDVKVGIVTAIAIIAHEIPQEVGDFLILLHSGYSKKQAFIFNLVSSLATVVGGVIAYFALQFVQGWIPTILGIAAASMLYVAVADLIPSLHKRTELRATISQLVLIACGVSSIWLAGYFLE